MGFVQVKNMGMELGLAAPRSSAIKKKKENQTKEKKRESEIKWRGEALRLFS